MNSAAIAFAGASSRVKYPRVSVREVVQLLLFVILFFAPMLDGMFPVFSNADELAAIDFEDLKSAMCEMLEKPLVPEPSYVPDSNYLEDLNQFYIKLTGEY